MPLRYGSEVVNSNYAHRTATVATTAVTAVGNIDGSTVLKDRKYIVIWVPVGNTVFWSHDSTLSSSNVTTIASGAITAGDEKVFPIGPNIGLYLVCQTKNASVSITELS